MSANPFLSTGGLGNEITIKSKLLQFSLIHNHIQFPHAFWFHNVPSLGECSYILTVWLGILGFSKSGTFSTVSSLDNIITDQFGKVGNFRLQQLLPWSWLACSLVLSEIYEHKLFLSWARHSELITVWCLSLSINIFFQASLKNSSPQICI